MYKYFCVNDKVDVNNLSDLSNVTLYDNPLDVLLSIDEKLSFDEINQLKFYKMNINRFEISHISNAYFYELSAEFNNIDEHTIVDAHQSIRQLFARLFMFHDILVNDPSFFVRYYVAVNGDYAEILSEDESSSVRANVARHGYQLEKLIHDTDVYVILAIVDRKYKLDFIYEKHGHNDSLIQAALIKNGYNVDLFVNSSDKFMRGLVASKGKHLDVLVNDDSEIVRVEVAKQGYGLDQLIDDDSFEVRAEVAKHGYRLDLLIKDDSFYVRAEVAKRGYGLEQLIADESDQVRYEVALHDYGLNVLKHDKSDLVKYTAKDRLSELRSVNY